MKRFSTLVLAAALIFFAGCPVTPTPESDAQTAGGTSGVAQVDTLFVETTTGSGQFVFTTNDTAYWGAYGCTLWTLRGESEEPFVSREVTLNKVSGNGSAGYGAVFCCYDTGAISLGETMLVVMINTRREYIVGEVTGAAFTEIIPWTESENLIAGYNVANTVSLAYDAAEGEFSLSLNGGPAVTFRDDVEPYHDSGGRNGYMVVISPLDDFPDTPVHVIFTEK
jgi:hypothetical protein